MTQPLHGKVAIVTGGRRRKRQLHLLPAADDCLVAGSPETCQAVRGQAISLQAACSSIPGLLPLLRPPPLTTSTTQTPNLGCLPAASTGLACAEVLGGAGASILIADINEEALREAEAHLQQRGIAVVCCINDVGDKASVQAGQAAARQMVEQNKTAPGQGGAIINMSSVNAYVAIPTIPNYCAANSLTRAMAISLAPHSIRVNAVDPGSISTEILDHVRADRECWRSVLSRTPMLRAGLPSGVANAVTFSASSDSSYVTGQVVMADGGRTILNLTVEVPEDS